jgi:hypothetical protein
MHNLAMLTNVLNGQSGNRGSPAASLVVEVRERGKGNAGTTQTFALETTRIILHVTVAKERPN